MKSLIIITLFSLSSLVCAESQMSPDDALSILKIHETFSEKKIKNTPSLCEYHAELVKIAQKKHNLPNFECSNRNEGSETKDVELSKQLKTLNNVVAVSEGFHPDTELTPVAIQEYVVRKLQLGK